MEFTNYFSVWNELTPAQQGRLEGAVMSREIKKGTVIHRGSLDCTGLLLVRSGQLRAYILSDEGREITIYRLIEMDVCLFPPPVSCGIFNLISPLRQNGTHRCGLFRRILPGADGGVCAVANYTNV